MLVDSKYERNSFPADTESVISEMSEKSLSGKLTLETPYIYLNEKSAYGERKDKYGRWRKFLTRALQLSVLLWILSKLSFNHEGCMSSSKDTTQPFSLRNLQTQQLDQAFIYENSSKPHEVIEIPLSPHEDISSPVYSQQLLKESFALSWSKPVLLKYTPPPSNISYDRIILTLDTTIDGVQYDRLVHIYLGDNEIWRSSTMEPSGQLSHSFAQKDVTLYYDLFDKKGDMLFQLDNLVTKKLTGAFNITLSALYFKDETKGSDRYGRTPSHPKIIPLTKSVYGSIDPPLIYYPDSKLSLSLPKSPNNVTNLLLLLTTSPNAAEEFWYSNLLDEHKDAFVDHGRHFYGHGSCRVINVYADGVRVHSANPKPYIFSGGIAPTLWNTIVSVGAFDISPYLIDLTPILPLMWDESINLEVEISNCVDDDEKATLKSSIGSNWITSASLALFEDEEIDCSFGQVESIQNSTTIKSFAINPPFSGFLTQILKASYNNVFETNVTHVYKNGTQVTEISTFENYINQTSMNVITKWGDSQSVLSLPKLNTTVTILNGDTMEPIKEVTKLANSSIANKLSFLPPKEGSADISYSTNISVSLDIAAYKGKTPIFVISSKENGTADFTIAENGPNFGSASVMHNYTLTDIKGHVYNRVALAENSTLVSDKVTETNATGIYKTAEAFDIPLSVFTILEMDWLSPEELNELESYLSYDELSELTNALLDYAF